MNWNLKSYLPIEAACQESFNRIIAGYIVAIYEHMRRNEQSNSGMPRVRRQSTSQSLTVPLGLDALENTAEFAKKFISGELSQKFFLSVHYFFCVFFFFRIISFYVEIKFFPLS